MRLCTLASGSSGNAAILSGGRTNILLDAGISTRRIVSGLKILGIDKEELGAVMITHEHADHINGLRVLVKHTKAPIYAPIETAQHIINRIEGIKNKIIPFAPGDCLEIGDMAITSFATPHDSASSCGYSFYHKRSKVTCVTDLGHITEQIKKAVIGSDILMLEANHDEELLKKGSYPYFLKKRILSDKGHLSNRESGRLAAIAAAGGTRLIILAHLSRENNTPRLAEGTVMQTLLSAGTDPDFRITVASPVFSGEIHNTDE